MTLINLYQVSEERWRKDGEGLNPLDIVKFTSVCDFDSSYFNSEK